MVTASRCVGEVRRAVPASARFLLAANQQGVWSSLWGGLRPSIDLHEGNLFIALIWVDTHLQFVPRGDR